GCSACRNRIRPRENAQRLKEGENMKQAATLALASLAGFALGAGAIQGLHAQATKTAPAYAVAEIEVTDPPAYQAYLGKAIESLKPYNAHIITRAKPNAKEGPAPQGNVVIT